MPSNLLIVLEFPVADASSGPMIILEQGGGGLADFILPDAVEPVEVLHVEGGT